MTRMRPIFQVSEYCFTSLSAKSRQREPRRRDYALLLFQMTSRVLYGAQYHRQHCTLHALEQFGAQRKATHLYVPDGLVACCPGNYIMNIDIYVVFRKQNRAAKPPPPP